MQVIILCGGQGTRLREKTETIPKPMVAVGSRPILWHIMSLYSKAGHKDFLLALGYKKEVIKDYFLNYRAMSSDVTITLGKEKQIEYHSEENIEDWRVTLSDTGDDSMTGARVARLEKYITGDTFMLTYGDGVCDVDISKLIEFHNSHGKIGTLTGVHVPSRFGKLDVDNDSGIIKKFTEKPLESGTSDYINGGYFVFKKEFFKYLSKDPSCILERDPLENLAADGQLVTYRHDGFWQCMDTFRDWQSLEKLWNSGEAPWKKRM